MCWADRGSTGDETGDAGGWCCHLGAPWGPNCFIPPPASSSFSFIPQTRVTAEKQKLWMMLKGLHRVLSDQESQFLSPFRSPVLEFGGTAA